MPSNTGQERQKTSPRPDMLNFIFLHEHQFGIKILPKKYITFYKNVFTTKSVGNIIFCYSNEYAIKIIKGLTKSTKGYVQLKILVVLTIKTGGGVRSTTNYFVIF